MYNITSHEVMIINKPEKHQILWTISARGITGVWPVTSFCQVPFLAKALLSNFSLIILSADKKT